MDCRGCQRALHPVSQQERRPWQAGFRTTDRPGPWYPRGCRFGSEHRRWPPSADAVPAWSSRSFPGRAPAASSPAVQRRLEHED